MKSVETVKCIKTSKNTTEFRDMAEAVVDHNYCYPHNAVKLKEELMDTVHKLEEENHRLKEMINDLHPQNQLEQQINNTHILHVYTSFNSIEQFNLFVDMAIKHYENYLKLYKKNLRTKFCLPYKHQIFIVLSRLRLGLLEQDVAIRYNISQPTVSSIFRRWLNVMHSFFIQLPIWPTKDVVQKFMPNCFKKIYPSTRVIIDGTEIFIQKPSNYVIQSSTYSTYKSHNTAKGIIGITPNGFVCFVSNLYPGRISERELLLRSGLLDKLTPGDLILADKGFTIDKECRQRNIDLAIPPFLNRGQQLNVDDEQTTRDIARIRIHVERAIRDVKLFRILSATVPNTMADQLNQIWIVCCHLTNLNNKPLLNR